LQDIEECAEHIAKDSPGAAEQLVERIWQCGQSLCTMPDRGRPGRVPGTRELVLPEIPYLIAYRVKRNEIQVLRVIHSARDWPRLAHKHS
jgi:plasmid stabilization system protein ParE